MTSYSTSDKAVYTSFARGLAADGESVGGYQTSHWSKTNAGSGAGESPQSGTGSAAWSHSRGPRAGAASGGLVGSPKCPRIVFTAGASVMKGGDAHFSPAEHAAQGQDLIDADAANSRAQRKRAGELLEPLQREGRASTVAQQPFQAGAVVAFDAHGGN
jgi:hypothetical protein